MILGALAASSCVERLLEIRAEPKDSHVYVNGRYVGRSPVEVPVRYYGKYRVDIWGPDTEYGPHTDWVDVRAPWYQAPGLDLVSELLDPRTHVDHHLYSVTLTRRERVEDPAVPPQEAVRGPRDELHERAIKLRRESR